MSVILQKSENFNEMTLVWIALRVKRDSDVFALSRNYNTRWSVESIPLLSLTVFLLQMSLL